MDTTKQYILMCEKSVEATKLTKGTIRGDIYCIKSPIAECKILTKEVYEKEIPENYKKYCVFSEQDKVDNNNRLGFNGSILVDNDELIKWTTKNFEYSKPCVYLDQDYMCLYNPECSIIWLPRQDQLQDMVDNMRTQEHLHFLGYVYKKMHKYDVGLLDDNKSPYFHYFKSMEQLWLAFVMKEKFNKTWKGEEWV